MTDRFTALIHYLFIQFSFYFVFRLLRICVTVFFATYLLILICSRALLQQGSEAIFRFADSSSNVSLTVTLNNIIVVCL